MQHYGLECTKVQFYKYSENLESLFGFYECIIESPLNSYLGLLLVNTNSGLIFPLGKLKGWYFSEELKFAKKKAIL